MAVSGAGEMELICYLHPGWAPLIRPAPATRAWMDATPESFARRCLPLNIANAHGWEILSPCGFEAVWNGEPEPEGATVWLDEGCEPRQAPVSLFGRALSPSTSRAFSARRQAGTSGSAPRQTGRRTRSRR